MVDTVFVDKQTLVPAAWLNDVNADVYKDHINLMRYIPPALHADIRAFTSVVDCTSYILDAFAAANGREIYAPVGLYNHTAITYAKSLRFHLRGEKSSYDTNISTTFNCTAAGTNIGLQLGVDDGNPDITGPIRDIRVSNINFTTSGGVGTAIRVQNTAICKIDNNIFRNFTGTIIDCRANVLLEIEENDIAGTNVGTGCYGIWLDTQYFGNFVTTIRNNHIFQVNWGIRLSEGRSVTIESNTFENIKPGTGTCGQYLFETNGYISDARFINNYSESQQGYVFNGASFTGLILFLLTEGNEYWGSGDASNINPGFGNIPRTRVMNHKIDREFVVDSEWNSRAFLALPSVFPTTTIFDQTTTIIKDVVTNKEYEEAIKYSLSTTEMLGTSGDFSMVTGGVAGAMTITGAGATPAGWTNLSTPQWQLNPDAITGTWVCQTIAGADFNRCSNVIALTPVNRDRFFSITFTTKNWSALSVDGVAVYDSGANITNWHTETINFIIAPNAASFTLRFMTNAGNPFSIAEARLWEIGSAEYNEPGQMNNSLTKAVRSLMKRGAF